VRRLTALLVLLTAFALNGCSHLPYVRVLNNAGDAVVVLRARADAASDAFGRVNDWPSGYTRIADRSGQDIIFRSPGLIVGVEIRIAGCTSWYTLADAGDLYGDALVVQLEPDRRLYFVATGMSNIRDLHARPVRTLPEQPVGFPVSPESDCAERSASGNRSARAAFSAPNDRRL
jgi:hypothetical protein